ncbi:MAG: pseudouridine synthase [Synechococcus sp.]
MRVFLDSSSSPSSPIQNFLLITLRYDLVRYLLFNKPYGVLTQFTDTAVPSTDPQANAVTHQSARPTLKQFIDVPDVYPVGRLDRDSEGLLLLTDDGRLASRLIHPKYGHERTYWAQVEGIPTETVIQQLQKGVVIKGYKTQPARVRAIADPHLPERAVPIRYRKSIPTSWLELCLTEGKNRQVRRMTAAVGYPTLRLVRAKLAFLSLGTIESGQWRDLTSAELRRLKELVGQRRGDRQPKGERKQLGRPKRRRSRSTGRSRRAE